MFKGTIISQIIGVIGSVFLAKIYAPELYGHYSVFLSVVSILSILNSFRLEYIVITEKSDKESHNLVSVLVLIIFIASIIQLLLFLIIKKNFFQKEILLILISLSVITAFFISNTKSLESFATRHSLFKVIANAKVLTTSCTILFQFLLLYFVKESGLIYGYIGSIIITFIYYHFATKKKKQRPDFQLANRTIRKHINILRFGFPSGLINTIAINIMPILMLYYFSSTTVGVYALSLKIVSIPLFLISTSISQVYFQKASELFNNDKTKLFALTKKIALTNISIMILILILINTIGISILTLFFDADWVNLRRYVLILSFYILGQATFSPISPIIVIANKMQVGLIFNTSLLFVNFLAIYIGNINNDILLTIKLLSFIGGASYVILLFYFLSLLKNYKNES